MQDFDFDKALGQRCRLLRERSGYTQKDAAIHVGVSTQQMQKYESGKNRINALVLFKLKRLYGVEWSIFFEDLIWQHFSGQLLKRLVVLFHSLPGTNTRLQNGF